MKINFLAGIALLLASVSEGSQAAYHIIQRVPVSGDGGWDYVTCDSQARRLYISHSTQTQVMDIDKLTVVGQVPATNGVHGIALAPELGRGFISAGRDNQVVIFDLKTFKSLGTVKTGDHPDAIVYDPASQRVFAFNGGSQSATIFNGATGELQVTLPLGGKPEFAVADGHGSVYLDLEDKSEIVKINTRAMNIDARWPTAPCEEPSSIAMDVSTNRLFVGCENKRMVIVNAATGKIIKTVPIGEHVDATVFDPQAKVAISSNGDGTLSLVPETSADVYGDVQTVATERGARTLALDLATHRLFLPIASFGPPEKPTADHPHPRPSIVPGSFAILVVAP